jgi:hypothetical protein
MLVDAAYPINESLHWAKQLTQKHSLSRKYLRHVDPKRLGHGKQNQKVYPEL